VLLKIKKNSVALVRFPRKTLPHEIIQLLDNLYLKTDKNLNINYFLSHILSGVPVLKDSITTSICAFAINAHKESYVLRIVIAFHSIKILISSVLNL
jgi:hypothetical protein